VTLAAAGGSGASSSCPSSSRRLGHSCRGVKCCSAFRVPRPLSCASRPLDVLCCTQLKSVWPPGGRRGIAILVGCGIYALILTGLWNMKTGACIAMIVLSAVSASLYLFSILFSIGTSGIFGIVQFIWNAIVVVYLIARYGEFGESARVPVSAPGFSQVFKSIRSQTNIKTRCHHCGHLNGEDANFWEKCGGELCFYCGDRPRRALCRRARSVPFRAFPRRLWVNSSGCAGRIGPHILGNRLSISSSGMSTEASK